MFRSDLGAADFAYRFGTLTLAGPAGDAAAAEGRMRCSFRHIHGHSGQPWDELADVLIFERGCHKPMCSGSL